MSPLPRIELIDEPARRGDGSALFDGWICANGHIDLNDGSLRGACDPFHVPYRGVDLGTCDERMRKFRFVREGEP